MWRVNRVNIPKNDCRKKIFYNNSLNVVNSTGCYCRECLKVISPIVVHLTLTSDYNFSSAPHYCGADVYSDFII